MSRDHETVRGRDILHSTLRRDYVCGECGSRLTTRWFEDAPHWRTVCFQDTGHASSQFVTSTTWEIQKAMATAMAEDVLIHLPDHVRAMME